MKDKIDLIFSNLKNECITEKQAHQQVLDLFTVMPSLPQSDTCPKCSAYDWSYHAGIEKMKCGDCGYEA